MKERLGAVLRFAASHLRLTFFTLLLLYGLGWLALWSVQSSWLHVQWIQMRYGTLDPPGLTDALPFRSPEDLLYISMVLQWNGTSEAAERLAALVAELTGKGVIAQGALHDSGLGFLGGCFPKTLVLELASRPEVETIRIVTPASPDGVPRRTPCEEIRHGTLERGLADMLPFRDAKERLYISLYLKWHAARGAAERLAALVAELTGKGFIAQGMLHDSGLGSLEGCFTKALVLELASRPEVETIGIITPASPEGVPGRSPCA